MDSTPATKFGLREMQSCGKNFSWRQLCMKALRGELGRKPECNADGQG
jgi:hypothetical protein